MRRTVLEFEGPDAAAFSALVPYYRRTLPNGLVRIFLRNAKGGRGKIECEPSTARSLHAGKAYTLQVLLRP